MKKLQLAAAALLASVAVAVPAMAAPITYTYTSTFTGTNNGNAFTIGATFTGVGDTSNTTTIDGFPGIKLTSLTAQADGPYVISTPFVIGFNADGGVAGFLASDTNGFSFFSPTLVGYNGVSNITALTEENFTDATFTTDRGNIHLTGQSVGTFTASVGAGAVPEPATWAMMLVGFGMVGFGLRRRTSAVRVTYA